MLTTTTADANMERAKRIWAEYQQSHDVTVLQGQTVAVDLETERVLTGPSARAITKAHPEVGTRSPLLVVRPSEADLRLVERLRGVRWRRVS
jgi:hypothetical protein